MFLKVEIKSKEPRCYQIDRKELVIGFSQDLCNIFIDHPSVSRRHIKILEYQNKYYVTDQGSTNGTFLKGQQLIPGNKVELKVGEKLRLGLYVFISLIEKAQNFERILELDLDKARRTKSQVEFQNRTQIITAEEFKAAKERTKKKKLETEKQKKIIEREKKWKDIKNFFKGLIIATALIYGAYELNTRFKERTSSLKQHSAVKIIQSKIEENQQSAIDVMGYRLKRSALLGRDKLLEYVNTTDCAHIDLVPYCQSSSLFTGAARTESGANIFILNEGELASKVKTLLLDNFQTEDNLKKLLFLYVVDEQMNKLQLPNGDTFFVFFRLNESGVKGTSFVVAFNPTYAKDIEEKFNPQSLPSMSAVTDMITNLDPYYSLY